jgi:hypothetical protein
VSRQPYTFTTFGGGLDLASQPGLVAFDKALDCLNVTFTSRGAVESRGGYAAFSGTLTNQPDSLGGFIKSDGTKRLLVGNGNRIDVLDTGGSSVANTTSPTASPHYFVRFGSPSVEAIYMANGTDQVRRYDTSGGFTSPAGLAGQTGKFLAVSPASNRLVVARESGSTAGNNPSSVNFSDAGDPETFTSTNFIDLDPGDGEAIMGMASFRGQLLIFKGSKMWRHYGESTDAVGEPVFDVLKMDTGGVGLAASRALAVSDDAVYFLHGAGVYSTSGGPPQRVSDIIEPFFLGGTSIYFQSQPLNHSAIDKAAMCWHDNRLYLAVPTGSSTTNDRVLVYDPRIGWWSIYDLPAAAMVPFPISAQPELVFARSATSKTVARHKTGRVTFDKDDMTQAGTGGANITSRWRSGWTDLGTQSEKRINDIELYGTGAATVRSWVNWNATNSLDGHPQTLDFTGTGFFYDNGVLYDNDAVYGPVPVVSRKTHTAGYQATNVSLDCRATVRWSLNVATYMVAGVRSPGLKHP